jgi:hypothetical protein
MNGTIVLELVVGATVTFLAEAVVAVEEKSEGSRVYVGNHVFDVRASADLVVEQLEKAFE